MSTTTTDDLTSTRKVVYMPGMDATMHEYGMGRLHAGSKRGPVVRSRKQAIAIGLNEQRKQDGDADDYARGKSRRRRGKGIAHAIGQALAAHK